MINNSENPQVINDFSAVVTAIKIVVIAIFLIPLARYTIVSKDDRNATSDVTEMVNETLMETKPDDLLVLKVRKVIVRQPGCPKSQLLMVLNEICEELVIKHEFCTPQDFYDERKHKVPKRSARNRSNKDPKVPTIINYAVGGLLMTSLGAALLEFYKARRQPSKKDGKNSLSRKCSLADLTVMKHHRKELVRKESLMEMPEEGHTQPGLKRPPLHRRCSFPIPLASESSPRQPSSAVFLDGRRQSIILEGRRSSIDAWGAPMDGRRLSEHESPERRHHSRLVHRH